MDHQTYPFILNEEKTHYKFISIGKRGAFEKAITFSRLTADVYNLALLDFSSMTQDYVDDTVTDNGDMPEVLATVLSVVYDYLKDYPNRYIILTGNTKSRTRLYQIAIRKVLDELDGVFYVWGQCNDEWVLFEPNTSYDSFLIARKFINS